MAATAKKPIDAPAYTLREATRLTGISFGALHSWTAGPKPIIRLESEFWSFTNLVEAYTLRALRNHHLVRLHAVRKAVAYVEEQLDETHPLASKCFKTDGVDLFVERYGKLINASRDGQTAMREMFEARLRQVEYGRHGRAIRLFMDDEKRLIVIDPTVGFGRPVVAGTGVPVKAIVDRFNAGEEPSSLADDYELSEESINQAIRTTLRTHAAA